MFRKSSVAEFVALSALALSASACGRVAPAEAPATVNVIVRR